MQFPAISHQIISKMEKFTYLLLVTNVFAQFSHNRLPSAGRKEIKFN